MVCSCTNLVSYEEYSYVEFIEIEDKERKFPRVKYGRLNLGNRQENI